MPASRSHTLTAAAVVALACAMVAAADAGAHVQLRSFTITPSCSGPGSKIEHKVTVRQRHPHHIHVLWARVTVRHVPTGLVVQQRDQRTRRVPFGTYTSGGRSSLPSNAPTGNYRVTLKLGSRRGATDYGIRTRMLRVRPVGLCAL
jgi:hypothetical protein